MVEFARVCQGARNVVERWRRTSDREKGVEERNSGFDVGESDTESVRPPILLSPLSPLYIT